MPKGARHTSGKRQRQLAALVVDFGNRRTHGHSHDALGFQGWSSDGIVYNELRKWNKLTD
jgi:hypothetical protein